MVRFWVGCSGPPSAGAGLIHRICGQLCTTHKPGTRRVFCECLLDTRKGGLVCDRLSAGCKGFGGCEYLPDTGKCPTEPKVSATTIREALKPYVAPKALQADSSDEESGNEISTLPKPKTGRGNIQFAAETAALTGESKQSINQYRAPARSANGMSAAALALMDWLKTATSPTEAHVMPFQHR